MILRLKMFSVVFTIFFLFGISIDFSQVKSQIGREDLFRRENDRIKNRIEKRNIEFVLEDAIDANTYLIGPGDLLFINLWGEEEDEFECMVLPEGNIIIPNVGSLMVNGLTLKNIKEIIKEKVNRFYPEPQITVSLGDIRMIKVYLTGEVKSPGSYEASPVERVSNIIALGDSLTSWADKRNIEVRHLDGTTELFNLLEFENKGEIKSNLFVRGGDVIYVPRVKLFKGMIYVSGNISKPGYHQFYENEILGDLIKRIIVRKETTDWENSYIIRKSDPGSNKLEKFSLDFLSSSNPDNNAENTLLKNEDYIYLPRKIDEVYVYGAVRNAGAFPFYSNMSSSDYAGLAGKTERAGSNSKIKVFKKNSGEIITGADIPVERGDKIEIPVKRMEIAKDYLSFLGTFLTVLIAAKAVGIY